jgi:hypothetical protein
LGGKVGFSPGAEPFVGRRLLKRLIAIGVVLRNRARLLIESLAEELGADETESKLAENSIFVGSRSSGGMEGQYL